jgi:hypothetical protein
MLQQRNAMLSKRFKAFSLLEIIVAMACSLVLVAPSVDYLFTQLKVAVYVDQQNDIAQQASYILMLIGDELQFSKLNEDWIPQEGSPDQSLLAFFRYDGKFVRYYLRNNEIVKDFNYSVYNAISSKLFRSFQVKRRDTEKHINISIKITGLNDEEFQQSWNVQKP